MCFLLREVIFEIMDTKDTGFINKGKWLNHNMLSYIHIIYFNHIGLNYTPKAPKQRGKRRQTALRKTAFWLLKGHKRRHERRPITNTKVCFNNVKA